MLTKYFNKILLYNILLAIAVVVVGMWLVQSGLKSYTRHGESITVPDLRGMTYEQVKSILDGKNLNWQVMDSVFDMNKAPLSILEQNPKPNAKVKEGRTIYITVNATKAPTTAVPDLVGRSSLKYARMQLESFGLKVGELIYKPNPHLNSVIGMMLNGKEVVAKTKVPRGTVIDLVLGDGLGGEKMMVPYLIGLRYDEAEFKLKGNSLNIGAVVIDAGVRDTSGAIVYRQSPEFGPGNRIRMGEPIDLFLAKELPADIEVNPDLYDAVDSSDIQ
ncbi:MAG: PASTA domain-containing protein [Bacteroidetes bacterium]|nr:PASTA domain-containing protein [Bacteroidota bacterium]